VREWPHGFASYRVPHFCGLAWRGRLLEDLPDMTRPLASPLACAMAAGAFLVLALPSVDDAEAKGKGCPAGMVSIRGKFCIDQYEASTVEILGHGKTRAHSSYE